MERFCKNCIKYVENKETYGKQPFKNNCKIRKNGVGEFDYECAAIKNKDSKCNVYKRKWWKFWIKNDKNRRKNKYFGWVKVYKSNKDQDSDFIIETVTYRAHFKREDIIELNNRIEFLLNN